MPQVPTTYSGAQKLLHWGSAALVLLLLPLGFAMVSRGKVTNFDAVTGQLYAAHKSFGFILLVAVLARILLRFQRGVPAPALALSPWQAHAATMVHGLLYLLLLALPLLGWAAASAYGALGLLGGVQLPEILPQNPELAKRLFWLHWLGALVLAVLVSLHIAASLAHRFWLKDGVMHRMAP